MKAEFNEVKNVIRSVVERHIGFRIVDDNKNLFSDEFNPIVPNYLYILKDIENQYGTIIYRIIENHNYTIFTINRLSKAIVESVSQENIANN